jgi:hypothetical protein
MTDGLRVTIAGLDFYGQGSDGFIISPDGFSGWDDGVDMRLENTARPGAHGSFNLPVFQDARTVSISGNAFADSGRELDALSDRFTGLLAGGQVGRIQVEKRGVGRWTDCRLAAKPMFTEVGGQDCASFQIQVWCPDPRKFGESKTIAVDTGSPISVFHRGNYNAMPSFIVRGDMPGGWTLTVNGWNYTVTKPLVSGAPHRVDYNNGRLYVNGTLSQGNLGNTNTTPIPPGQSVGVGLYPVTTGTGSADMTITDTYI